MLCHSLLRRCEFTRHIIFFTHRTLACYSKLPRNKVQLVISQGRIIGNESKLPNETAFYSFQGIPYAESPVGPRRFATPKPLHKFKDPVLDCTRERDVCFHRDPFTREWIGSVDCLFLNVYVPSDAEDLPVMIWIHGGSFLSGSGSSDYYSPEYLLEQNVIVVTINYRLGAFGFLCLPDAGIYGNAGLKDQRLAMQWVQQNIADFGGNPDNVTIFGESAGGSSIHIHTISPKSRKLFHKSICQTGTAIIEWVRQPNAEEKSKILARNLGCTATDSKKILAFLCSFNDLPKMNKEIFKTMTPDERRRGFPIVFKPSVEQETDESIITRPPLELLKSPIDSRNIPIMMGYNSMDGLVILADAVVCKKLELYDNDLARLIPKSVNLAPEDERCKSLANRLRQFYFNGKRVCDDTLEGFADLYTDTYFSLFTYLSAELHARYQNSPMYFYRFSVDKDFNLFKELVLKTMGMANTKRFKGAYHTDEIYYLFTSRKFPKNPKDFPESEKLLRRSCKLWTNFAKYGNPTPEPSESEVRWKPVEKVQSEKDKFVLNYLEIDNDQLINAVNPDEKRIEFWRNIYDEYNNGLENARL